MPDKRTDSPRSSSSLIASIMVHVDWGNGSDDRIRLAADLARRFGAVLIGVAGWIAGREAGGWFAAELERPEDRMERVLAELDRLADRFRDVAGTSVQHVEWRGSFNFPHEVIPREARAADLVVIGSHSTADDIYRAFDPGSVLLAAGRPVLIAPDGVSALSAKRVLVAWKETREARRAVQSALPFLQAAEDVAVVEVADAALESAAKAHLSDIETYLSRHRVTVSAKTVQRPEGSTPDQLQAVAKDEGADLIVAGAYGHTRLGEWVFGGVTRDLLGKSKICCLFSN